MEWKTSELAKHLDISSARVYQLVNDGVFKHVAGKKFNSEESVHAYIKFLKGKNIAGTDERARLDRLRADKLELELKQLKAELVPVDLCERYYINQNHAVRQKLFSIPGRMAPLCAGKTAAEIQVKVHNILNEIMRELRDPDFSDMIFKMQNEQRAQKLKRKNS